MRRVIIISLFLLFACKPSYAASSTRLTLPLSTNVTVIDQTFNDQHRQIGLVSDSLSSTKVILTQEGVSQTTPQYYPYGASHSEITNNPNNRFYTGQRKVSNDDTLYNYNARCYSPETGIFTQPDTVEGINRFAYVAGSPIMNNDPSGHMSTGSEADGGGHWMRQEKEPTLLNKVDLEISQLGLYGMGSLATKVLKTISGIGYDPARDWNLKHEAYLEQFRLKDELGRRIATGMPPVMGPMQLGKLNVGMTSTTLGGIEATQIERSGLGLLTKVDKAARRLEAQQILRTKYGLPPRDMRFEEPLEYMRRLQILADEHGFEIRPHGDFERFFDEYSAGGVYLDKERVAVMGKSMDENLVDYMSTAEHEVVHGIQYARYPRMSIRRMEYEAYLAGGNPRVIRDDPGVFAWFLNTSLRTNGLINP